MEITYAPNKATNKSIPQEQNMASSSSTTNRLCFLTATQLIHGYKRNEFTPAQVIEDVLLRISEVNHLVNAYNFVEEKQVLMDLANQALERYRNNTNRLLEGVPISVKDILMVTGWRTHYGSKAWIKAYANGTDGRVAIDTEDSPSVQRLKEEGAILIGKVTTPEFGWQGVTRSPLTGDCRNPFDPRFTSGGSSGGSAVAVALGMAPMSLGTDAGGSVRIPACWTGTSTLKATFARVAHAPPSAFGTLSHVGPMALTIEDAALMLDVIGKPHPKDPYSILPEANVPLGPHPFSSELNNGVKGLRIAVSLNLGGYVPYCDPQIIECVKDAAKVFEQLGAIVEYADPPIKEFDTYKAFKTLWCCGAANLIDKKFGACKDKEACLALMDNGLRQIAQDGLKMSSVDVMGAEFTRASLGRAMNDFHSKYHLLLTPTLPIAPFPANQEVSENHWLKWQNVIDKSPESINKAEDKHRWWSWTPYTYPFNLTRQPAASVPCGWVNRQEIVENEMNPFPVGLQIVGPLWSEALVLRAAHAYQSATNFVLKPEQRLLQKQ